MVAASLALASSPARPPVPSNTMSATTTAAPTATTSASARNRSTFAAASIIVPVVYCGMVAHELVEGRVGGSSSLTLGWLAALAAVSALSFLATLRLVPVIKDSCLKAGLSGRDINKGGSEPMYVETRPRGLSYLATHCGSVD